jgi:CBS domain-containing protein
MKVREAMHEGVKWATPDTPVIELAHMMRAHDVGAIPIGDKDRLVGIVTDRDIICRGVAGQRDLSALKARDVMTKGVIWCRDDQDLADAAHIMEDRKVRRLPVIDGDKRMVGMLALGDLSPCLTRAKTGNVISAVSAHH